MVALLKNYSPRLVTEVLLCSMFVNELLAFFQLRCKLVAV
jgi:hypothetical protein